FAGTGTALRTWCEASAAQRYDQVSSWCGHLDSSSPRTKRITKRGPGITVVAAMKGCRSSTSEVAAWFLVEVVGHIGPPVEVVHSSSGLVVAGCHWGSSSDRRGGVVSLSS
ncbi:unnamed protein product, partial [Pylaiella littoralis]